MGHPYREQAGASARSPVDDEELARFDASGDDGADGAPGRAGRPGRSDGEAGWHGEPGGPAQPGQDAGRVQLSLSGDEGVVKLAGQAVAASGVTAAIDTTVFVRDRGTIVLTAVGGDGGRGGDGGDGGNGATGRRGSDATRYSSGDDGEPGGNGGSGGAAASGARGGRGGEVGVSVSEDDTPLLMLIEHRVDGGSGGPPGRPGDGGRGGDGGPGGSSYSWTEEDSYTDSNGDRPPRRLPPR